MPGRMRRSFARGRAQERRRHAARGHRNSNSRPLGGHSCLTSQPSLNDATHTVLEDADSLHSNFNSKSPEGDNTYVEYLMRWYWR